MHRPDYDFDVITGPATALPTHAPEPPRTAEPTATADAGTPGGQGAGLPRQGGVPPEVATSGGDGGAAGR